MYIRLTTKHNTIVMPYRYASVKNNVNCYNSCCIYCIVINFHTVESSGGIHEIS